jgi:hypothetical protein
VTDYPDAVVADLARLFREHPAWQAAARRIDAVSTSDVYFRHRPGEPWHLVREGPASALRAGASPDPDFVFRFAPGAVARLAAVEGGIGDFAVELFSRALDPDPQRRVDLRIVAAFWRLTRRGYVRLLLAAGPEVLAFGARHGVRDARALARLVARLRQQGPYPWEAAEPPAGR